MCSVETKLIPNEEFIPEIGALIKTGKDVTIKVRGNSMNPAIVDRRDQITFSPFEDSDLKRGAVILALTSELGYVAHRVIKREGDLLYLKGDGNGGKTIEHTRVDQVIGVATILIRKDKYISFNSKGWRLYSKIWMALTPLRRYILWGWRRLNLR